MSDAKDNERFELIDDVRKLIDVLRGKCPAGQDAEEWDAMLDAADEDLSRIEHSLELYVQHLLRKALSSSITPRALEALKANPRRCHLIVDYKQKWLPVKHHETQSDSFGKKGKSIWGGCAIRYDPSTGDYEVINVRIGAQAAPLRRRFHVSSLPCVMPRARISHLASPPSIVTCAPCSV